MANRWDRTSAICLPSLLTFYAFQRNLVRLESGLREFSRTKTGLWPATLHRGVWGPLRSDPIGVYLQNRRYPVSGSVAGRRHPAGAPRREGDQRPARSSRRHCLQGASELTETPAENRLCMLLAAFSQSILPEPMRTRRMSAPTSSGSMDITSLTNWGLHLDHSRPLTPEISSSPSRPVSPDPLDSVRVPEILVQGVPPAPRRFGNMERASSSVLGTRRPRGRPWPCHPCTTRSS